MRESRRPGRRTPRPVIAGGMAWLEALWGRRLAVFVAALALDVAIALPFLGLDRTLVRGVPGPSLLAVAITGAFILGPAAGLVLGTIGSGLAVAVLDANLYLSTPLWLALSLAFGLAGRQLQLLSGERARLQHELQAGLLPASRLQHRQIVTADRYVPAERRLLIGGDFFAITETPDGGVAALVGDVAGHGPTAAAIGTHLRSTWLALIRADVDPRTLLRVLNESMHAERRRRSHELFATVCCAWISAPAEAATVVLAGHPAPIALTADGARALDLEHGPPLGVVDMLAWTPHPVALPARPWSLVLYSDGLIENHAASVPGERFGFDRLISFLETRRPPLGDQDLDDLVSGISRRSSAPQDDVVVLTLSAGASPRVGHVPRAARTRG